MKDNTENKYEKKLDILDDNSSYGKITSRISPGSCILECGCSSGYMTKWMKNNLNCDVSVIEIFKGPFDQAMNYASDGYCGDLMGDEWLQHFSGKSFDYILFADVLEHLSDPLSVMKKAVTLLKNDGKIIVSIPNIAHNDILAKLYTDRFDYTNRGLLDNTHIHFWGRNNLDSFFAEAGLDIVMIDGVICKTNRSEQFSGDNSDMDLRLYGLLLERELGEVYQYVIEAQKHAFVSENHIECVDLLPKKAPTVQKEDGPDGVPDAGSSAAYQKALRENMELKQQIAKTCKMYEDSFCWKITAPVRFVSGLLRRIRS